MQTRLISTLTPRPKYAFCTTAPAPLRGSDRRWMDGDDEQREGVSDISGGAGGGFLDVTQSIK